MRKRKLDKSVIFRSFRDNLKEKYGGVKSTDMWVYANDEYERLMDAEPNADKTGREYVFPCVALYRAVERYAPGEALLVTRSFGTKMGLKMKKLFRKATSFPGVPILMWKNMDKISAKLSSGYEIENLSVDKTHCNMDVKSCPLYDKACELGTPEAVQMICCMDKEYMNGFRGVKYKRTKSVAEGDDCCDYRLKKSIDNHIEIYDNPYATKVKRWLKNRYGNKSLGIWSDVCKRYNGYLNDLPNYGGKENGHANAIYGGLLVFALYKSLPDNPPVEELSGFVKSLFMEPFEKLGKFFNLNRSLDMWLIDKVFRKSGNRDRKDIKRYPAGFINVDKPYDKENNVASYCFTQCPNAEFAKKHSLLHVLPLLCNCDFYGIEQIHGTLIRKGTCGNSDICDYLVVGDANPIAKRYETVVDNRGFIVSREKQDF